MLNRAKYYLSLVIQIMGELLLVVLFISAILLQRFYNYIGV
jgi:hypothetical protein